MYYIQPYYNQSNLTTIERKALPALNVLRRKVVTMDQIPFIKEWLERLRDQLEIENPRCKGIDFIEVKEFSDLHRLDISFGHICYFGFPCGFLQREDLTF